MRRCIAIVGACLVTAAFAQAMAPLPAKLSGRWVWLAPNGTTIDAFSLEFDGSREPGTVAGRLTWRGLNCGAQDEPIKAP